MSEEGKKLRMLSVHDDCCATATDGGYCIEDGNGDALCDIPDAADVLSLLEVVYDKLTGHPDDQDGAARHAVSAVAHQIRGKRIRRMNAAERKKLEVQTK